MQEKDTTLFTFHFENSGNHEVRTILKEDGSVWFVAKDVCDVLGITKYRDAITRLDDDEGCPVVVDTLGGKQNATAISESGLYALILRSRKREAKSFRKWVTSEVLPSIRRTGAYSVGQKPEPAIPQPDVNLQQVAAFLKATTDAYWYTYRAIGKHRAIESELKKSTKAIVAILDSIKAVFPESHSILDDIEGKSMDESRSGMPLPVEAHGITY